MNDFSISNLWKAIPKNVVFFDSFESEYGCRVEALLLENKFALEAYKKKTKSVKYLKLTFECVMFDCIAQDISNGFFDEDDVPPPEFWLDFKKEEYNGGYIIAFIPEEYLDLVDECVFDTMSGCMQWIDNEPI